MKILLTNDDGIYSEGLAIVAQWAVARGNEVWISAPDDQQSGKSHAITIHRQIHIDKVSLGLGEKAAYSVGSTPVDCVRFATLGLNERFDLIISGINKGYNLGEDILYSGTVGAIFEAKLRNTRGVALSTEFTTFDYAKASLDRIFDFFAERRLFDYNLIYNVNIPPEPFDVVLTRQGGPYFTDRFVDFGGGNWEQHGYCVHENRHDIEIDTDATIDGHISVSPLSVDRSDVSVLKSLHAAANFR